MKFVMQLGLGCLLASSAFAQSRGGWHAGSAGGHAGGVRVTNHGAYGRGSYPNLGRGFGNRGFYGGYAYWPDSYGFSSDSDSYIAGPNVTVVYPPAAAPTVAVPQTAHPVIHEYRTAADYGLPSEREDENANEPVLYLIAFRDSVIRPATTYWVQGDTLHYLGPDHKEQRAPLSSVDEDLSTRLNRERHVPFHL